jgi:hypothetical protein
MERITKAFGKVGWVSFDFRKTHLDTYTYLIGYLRGIKYLRGS